MPEGSGPAVMVRARACPLLFERAGSSPGAPHRGGGLPPSKPGLVAGTHDLESRAAHAGADREARRVSSTAAVGRWAARRMLDRAGQRARPPARAPTRG